MLWYRRHQGRRARSSLGLGVRSGVRLCLHGRLRLLQGHGHGHGLTPRVMHGRWRLVAVLTDGKRGRGSPHSTGDTSAGHVTSRRDVLVRNSGCACVVVRVLIQGAQERIHVHCRIVVEVVIVFEARTQNRVL